ncbi:MAG: Abi family protein [Culicoidibacterales bacterium]
MFVCDECVGGKHKYPETKFSSWESYYAGDCALSNNIRESLIDLERNINSKLAYQLSKMIDDNVLDNWEKLLLKTRIDNIVEKNIILSNSKEEYHFFETWKIVNAFNFGDTLEVLKWFDNACNKRGRNKRGEMLRAYWNDLELKFSLKDLCELKNMRNAVSHFTPLTIYLTTSLKAKNTKHKINLIKKITEGSLMYEKEIRILDLIEERAINFVTVKNMDNKKGD